MDTRIRGYDKTGNGHANQTTIFKKTYLIKLNKYCP